VQFCSDSISKDYFEDHPEIKQESDYMIGLHPGGIFLQAEVSCPVTNWRFIL